MKIGIAQLNTTVGDLEGNRRLILEAYSDLVARGAELVVTPELALTGYPPRDLLLRRRFDEDSAASLAAIAAAVGEVPLIVGCIESNRTGSGRACFNTAAFCHRGTVAGLGHKCLLPTYDVFDEDRYFEPAPAPAVVECGELRIGLTICEDLWTHPSVTTRRLYHGEDPVSKLAPQHCDLMINISASPWHNGKENLRARLVAEAARTLRCPVVYCNAVGGNDELIFDGRSLVADPSGRVVAGLPAFRAASEVVEIPVGRAAPAPVFTAPRLDPTFSQPQMKDIFEALVLGTRDYAQKSGFKRALVALSGGIDSAVVAVVAAAAFGPGNVTGVSLPSAISSQHSRDDARDLAAALRMPFHTVAIADAVAATETALAPLFTGLAPDVTEENIQARTRGVLMMALSNKFNALLLTTGNKSEMAVGYCTLYGDMCGGLAVISDLFKTQVYALARWINTDYSRTLGATSGVIPSSTIEKPPSAELRPGQKDQDSLPPYDLLDKLLQCYVEECLPRRDLIARGFDATIVNDVCRKVDRNEYKRKQAAPGLKITPLAFGTGRRNPIVQRYVS